MIGAIKPVSAVSPKASNYGLASGVPNFFIEEHITLLVIRPEQMKILGEVSFNQFVKNMVEFLKSNHAPRVAGKADSELRRLIEAGTYKAEEYGIETEDEVCGVIECVVVFGNAFDVENTWAAEILQDASIGADEKVRLLLEHVQLQLKEK